MVINDDEWLLNGQSGLIMVIDGVYPPVDIGWHSYPWCSKYRLRSILNSPEQPQALFEAYGAKGPM